MLESRPVVGGVVFRLCLIACLFLSFAHIADAQDMTRAFQSACGGSGCFVRDLARETLGPVARYRATLGVPGAHEIRIYRIVQERDLWRPRKLAHAVFVFGPELDAGLPAWLAARGIDVWGAFGGIDAQAGGLGYVLALARSVRALTGSGAGPIVLIAAERSARIGYVYAGNESQMSLRARSVAGLVALNVLDGTPETEFQYRLCAIASAIDHELASGFGGISARVLTNLAENAPRARSPIFADLTNSEAVGVMSSTARRYNPYSERRAAASAWALASLEGPKHDATAAPEPRGPLLQESAIYCANAPPGLGPENVIIPALYVDTRSTSMLDDGFYAATLLSGGADAHVLDARSQDPALARDARALVWQPILDWLERHPVAGR